MLVLGLFVPVIQMPIVGNVNIFADGTNLYAYVMLALAGLAAFLAGKERIHETIWPGAVAAALVVALFIGFQVRISRMKAELAASLEGNPFGSIATGMMDSVQLQWGWIVLAAGVSAILYAAVTQRKTLDDLSEADNLPKFASIALLVVGIGWLVYQSDAFKSSGPADTELAADFPAGMADMESNGAEAQVDQDTKRYIAENVEVYDLSARYQDSLLDGRVPGVDFKVKNNGERSLDEVEVTVVFYDSEGNAIAEDNYYPVLTSSYNNDPPLRPGYIWQQERGQFYAAKSVPDEWESGKVTAKVTSIEFSPEE